MQHKLNNDGHTSALRRLPPAEREKLKQYAEAENNNMLICPFDAKVGSVPYCAHAMFRKGGFGNQTMDKGNQDDDDSGDAFPEPPPLRLELESAANPKDGLIDDDNLVLVELKRDDDQDPDETPSSKSKKGTKNKSQKKPKNVIQIDFRTPGMGGDEVYPETLAPAPAQNASRPAAWFQNPATRNINGTAVSQAWNVKAGSTSEIVSSAQRPPNFPNLLRELVNLVGCSESKATELLEQNQFRLESAADAFFCQEPGGSEVVDNKPRWGPRVGAQQPSTRANQQPSQVSSTNDEECRQSPQEEEEDASGLQPPAPTQPPPPRLPPEWQALWNEQQNAYYYWHVPTNHTTWDPPIVDDESAEDREANAVAAARAAEEARQKAEEDGRIVMVKKVSDITGLSSAEARSLLESMGWGLEQALKSHNKEVELRKARELEELRRVEEEKRAEEEARKREEEALRERERHKRIEGERQTLPAEFIINQNWRPRDEGCIRLMKGERVSVRWMDDSLEGWVYGHPIDDEVKLGYFPRAVLQEVKHIPRQRDVGELCGIQDFFQAPQELRGYLNVAQGDLIKVLHPLDEPFVWAYVEVVKSSKASSEERGWLPECALCDPREMGLRCPHPAG